MKAGRRQDPDGLRRIPRERDMATMGRVRKRPSMLSEFQGKHYNHRTPNRESRPYHRYDQHSLCPGVIKAPKRDRFESRPPPYSRPLSHYAPAPLSFQEDSVPMEINNSYNDGDAPSKRPHLLEDMQLDTPVTSGTLPLVGPAASPSHHHTPTQGLGLSAYLEDIESDEGDLLVDDDDDKPPGTPEMTLRPPPPPSLGSGRLTKEQLLQKIEAVDRDIAATESQIAALLKRQAELEGNTLSTPSASTPSPLHPAPLPPAEEGVEEEGVSLPSEGHPWSGPRKSLLDSVYSENKMKARSAQAMLRHLSPLPLSSLTPVYSQPWQAPGYYDIVARHRQFRAELVCLLQRQRREKHEKELALCQRYDVCVEDWKKRLDRVESSSKRKARDLRNRELFERTFPELKLRREQQERLMRVDQRGYGVVRSDLELSQIMCELYEQEEAPARTRRTHAIIPAMVIGGPEERLAFQSTNGLIQDPMSLYRAAKITNVWTEGEKAIFREKYAVYAKNFEAIASFLPCKSTADCVRYYYLSKKSEKFKQVARKATFKRRKFIKPGELSGLVPHTPVRLGMEPKMRSPLLSEVMTPPHAPPTTATPTVTTPTTPRQDEVVKEEPITPKPSRYGDWTNDEIGSLRSGLMKWGRAWTKIYREVGGRKTATQCKQFFEDFSQEESLGLTQALSECSSIKSAEREQRKSSASRKPPLPAAPQSRKKAGKMKPPPVEPESEGERVAEDREVESEAVESGSNGETGSVEESGSESTLTDSSPEDMVPTGSSHSSVRQPWKRHTPSESSSHSSQAGSEKRAFDLFISAAEALNNIVPTEVALHDHNYALAPLSSVDSSGLSLIAAAAAVVSPTLSRSAGSGKFPAVSPIRAPRGRPPNTQRRGSSGSSCKLSPTLLSPAGSSIYVPLTDTTKTSFRSRARSAPSDRPRIQLSRAGPSNLRYSISSKSSSPRPILPPASYTRTKDTPISSAGGAPSLKSMIASRPQHGNNSSNAAFETLVNVAVAASPAELPKTTSCQQPTATLSISFPNSAPSAPVTTGTPLTDGTYNIDMSQAINILTLAQLAQSPVSTSGGPAGNKTPQPLLLAQGVGSQASGFLGTIVSQSNHEGGVGNPSNPNTVNVLIGHLTSGSASPSPSAPSESSVSSRNSPGTYPDPSHLQKPADRPPLSPAPPTPSSSSSVAQASSDDLSNLNLLSSLVAVVAGSQAPPTFPSHTPHITTTSTRPDAGSYSFAKPTFPFPTFSTAANPRSSTAFKATNLPPALGKDRKELSTRTKVHEKPSPNLSPLINSDHLRASSRATSPLDNLARSVVRSSSLTHPPSSHSTTNSSPHSHPPSLPMYPSPAPSISQQSTLLLYTRSLSLPNPSGPEVNSEEEDHLESATRGISELSKLLGTDTEALSSNSTTATPSYRNSWVDQGPGTIPPPPMRTARNPTRVGPPVFSSAKAELGNDSGKYLSGLLESHSSHHNTHSQKTGTSTDVTITHGMSSSR